MSQATKNNGDSSQSINEIEPEINNENKILEMQKIKKNGVFETSPLDTASPKFSEPQSPIVRSMSKLASQLSLKRDYTPPKNSTSRTILVMVNTLIGSGCLLLPLVMKDSGIITTILSLTIIGIISAKTCEIPLMHTEDGERDMPDIIVRLLGDKWYYLYSLSAGILEILIALAYYLMSCNMFYHFKDVDITWWTIDVGYIFGVIAILYLIHPNTVKIFAEHSKQEKNIPAHRWAFLITYSIYVFIGIFGYLGIINVSLPQDVEKANTVLDYFQPNDISNLLIALIFFGDLVSVFPILLQTGKVLCVQAIYVQYDVKKHKLITRIFDLVFMIISFLLGVFNISPSAVLSIAGAFIGLYFFFSLYKIIQDFYQFILSQFICIFFVFINKIFFLSNILQFMFLLVLLQKYLMNSLQLKKIIKFSKIFAFLKHNKIQRYNRKEMKNQIFRKYLIFLNASMRIQYKNGQIKSKDILFMAFARQLDYLY